ncbi:MAG: UDP-N-acetylmuramate dehydrogenase [Treponema sp.]|jgi:UDP-N-acetylmuramate dehydrogenase|nr:UDP-N-acetylmuramate dehydrogenase [Treponema sp.]
MDLRAFMKALNEAAAEAVTTAAGEGQGVDYAFDEPMAGHTTFQVGGPADLWVRPKGEVFPAFAGLLLSRAREAGIPVFILGGGANILVGDRGIRGIVLDTGGWTGLREEGERVFIKSGTPVDDMCAYVAGQGLSGLEFLAGMPGTLGGAVWMNARCYEKSLSDVLFSVTALNYNKPKPETCEIFRTPGDFGYKRSPFQGKAALIVGATVELRAGASEKIRAEMAEHRRDRESKGHYRYPSAGSAFKNNRDFGKPTGQIIDELGLKGFRVGGAQIAPWHGNIVINRSGASAADIRSLLEQVAARVKTERGLCLEREILLVGEWTNP